MRLKLGKIRRNIIGIKIFQMVPLANVIRLAVWLKLDIHDKSDEEVIQMVYWAASRSDKYYYIHGNGNS